jgi:hypothetical protein
MRAKQALCNNCPDSFFFRKTFPMGDDLFREIEILEDIHLVRIVSLGLIWICRLPDIGDRSKMAVEAPVGAKILCDDLEVGKVSYSRIA